MGHVTYVGHVTYFLNFGTQPSVTFSFKRMKLETSFLSRVSILLLTRDIVILFVRPSVCP